LQRLPFSSGRAGLQNGCALEVWLAPMDSVIQAIEISSGNRG
jgi:hypothetical protein